MKTISLLIFIVIFLLPMDGLAQNREDDMKPYPPAQPGFSRMVFRLPALENEADHEVEVIVGQTLMVDCNRTMFRGNLEQRVVEGWGYSYYILEKVGGPVSTLMACPPDAKKTEDFVVVRGEGFKLRYNSKLPVVVYVPQGFAVRYRIWSAAEKVEQAVQE
jgi:ecotin